MGTYIVSIFLYIYPTRCNVTQNIYIWKLLYMFRVVLPPTIRSAYNCIYSVWYLSHRYCYLPLPWKSWNRSECAVGDVRHPQHTQTILLGVLHVSRIRVKVIVHGNVTRIHTVSVFTSASSFTKVKRSRTSFSTARLFTLLALSSSNLFSFSCLLVYNRGIQ
jgi:hypothetical protein